MNGKTLGHYQVLQKLGEGGMGVVYQATDSRLRRQVAIKLLHESFLQDAERLARFEREARTLASLNHPNIAAIHGLEEDKGTRFLVLEFVAGDTLAQRISKGPLPVREALEICRQVAEALEAAHEKGIIHRDLKPANVKITPEGKVKVLDFGLAKPTEASQAAMGQTEAPTITAEMTQASVVMGTAAYMSPEQACAKPLDARTDIWSFGCVLYEALTGMHMFKGATTTEVLAGILEREPDWSVLPEAVPENVRRLLRRCLQKDLHLRLHHIADARIELEEAMAAPAVKLRPRPVPRLRLAIYGIVGLVVGAAAAAGLVAYLLHHAPAQLPVTRFAITLPANEFVHPLSSSSAVISPDGTRVVYVGNKNGSTQLYLRALDQLEVKPIPDTLGASGPFFSPDAQWVGFRYPASQTIKKLALSGGAPVTICSSETYQGAIWAPDDTILYASYLHGVRRVSAIGGQTKEVTTLDSKKEEHLSACPQLLPGGKAVLFTAAGGGMDSWDEGRITVQSLQSGERRVLIEGGYSARYSPSGHIVYARAGALLAVPFDVGRLQVTGPPVPVLEGVFMCPNNGAAHFSISDTGTLAYASGPIMGSERFVVWVDRQGNAKPMPLPPQPYLHPRLSPNGRQLAIEIEGPAHDFWIYDFERGTMTKITTDGMSHWPVWTPDGNRLTFRAWRTDGGFTMWWMPADRSRPEERLTSIGLQQSASSWSPDGRVLAFTQTNPETGADVCLLPMDGDQKPRVFAQTKFAEGSAKFSPDGRWIAYTCNESGRDEIYVQPYPGPGPKIMISTDGGTDATWKRNGGELYYRNGDKMMVVSVTTYPQFTASKPRMLWEGRYSHGLGSSCGPPGPTSSNYDVTADGQRFIMIREDVLAPAQINVVLNWAEELKRLVKPKNL